MRQFSGNNPNLEWKKIVENALRIYKSVNYLMEKHSDTRTNYYKGLEFLTGLKGADDVEKFLLEKKDNLREMHA